MSGGFLAHTAVSEDDEMSPSLTRRAAAPLMMDVAGAAAAFDGIRSEAIALLMSSTCTCSYARSRPPPQSGSSVTEPS